MNHILEKVEQTRQRRRRHIVIIATVVMVLSAGLFGYEYLGAGMATGIVGSLMVGLADL